MLTRLIGVLGNSAINNTSLETIDSIAVTVAEKYKQGLRDHGSHRLVWSPRGHMCL